MGKCPHCGSKNIRRRYREHERYKWRCRNCNGIFRAPRHGGALWLIVAAVVVVAASLFAVQQRMISLPPALSPIERKIDRVAEVVIPTATQATSTTAPTPEATLTPAVKPTQTPIPPPHMRYLDEKQYMLDLINSERMKAGLNAVELGDNNAAQLHAESALDNCFSSHWGVDGLKPYMRYSLAGGYQSNGENGHGSDYCITSGEGYKAIDSVRSEIDDAINGWMSSPGHRRNILDKHHKKVSIGMAWNRYNFLAFQHFEDDYVEYDKLPSISDDGILSVSGLTKNGVSFGNERDLGVQIYYDQPPHALTRGQVARTYCYDGGLRVASLREPLSGNSYWPEDEYSTTYSPCPDPYDVSPDASAPRSHNEASAFWEQAYQASRNREEQILVVPWITSLDWSANGNLFSVAANISDILNEYGHGVYTIVVWGEIDGEDTVISEYSIFHGITPPDTYTPPR